MSRSKEGKRRDNRKYRGKLHKRGLVNELRRTLQDTFPIAFPEEEEKTQPLAVGIHAEIRTRLGCRSVVLNLVMFDHTTSTPYLKALARGGERIDLEGNSSGVVDEATRVRAYNTLKEKARRRTRKRRERRKRKSQQIVNETQPLTS